MDGRLSAAGPSSSSGVATTAVSFPEENAIVLDKWLMDVCGEEDLQFPSHRRALYPTYLERLRRVAKARQFIANTFDYPSRSGTREVLVLQKTLDALGVEEQLLRREINQVQENVTQVRRVLDERTMGASSIVEEEKAQAAKLAEMRAEETAKAAAAAATARTSPAQASPLSSRMQGYAPLNPAAPVAVVTAPPPQPTTPARSKADTPLPLREVDDEDASTTNTSASSRSAAGSSAAASGGSPNTFSAVARAARRADYEKKKALSLRYLTEVEHKTQEAAAQRVAVEGRHADLLRNKTQLDQEYEALQTTEALVVARHEEAEAHEHEETAQLQSEVAAYTAEDAAFASVWEDMDAEEDDKANSVAPGGEAHSPHVEAAPTITAAEDSVKEVKDEERATAQAGPPAARHADPVDAPAFAETSPLDRPVPEKTQPAGSTASASLSPAEHDRSPPEATLTTHRPPSQGTDSVATSAASSRAASHTPSPVERVLELAAEDVTEHAEQQAAAPSQPISGARSTRAAPQESEARRVRLEELRHTLSELGAAAQACRRQLLNSSQTHMGRFRQSQQRLKDWQDMAVQVRATYEQLQGQVEVLSTALQDAAARLDADGTDGTDSSSRTYAQQLSKLNGLLKERSYETFQYYMGSGDAAATEMMFDANAEEELRALHRPSPSASAGGMTPVRGGGGGHGASMASSATPTRESSLASAHRAAGGVGTTPPRGGLDVPHKHRSRYELVRHLQRWEAALLTDRLAILKAAHMTPGLHNGAGANKRRADGFNVTRCYQELRQLLIQPKHANGSTAE